jgi:hypothetical protein
LRRFHHLWNGMAEGELPPMDDAVLASWGAACAAARARLLTQDDLLTRLLRFVAQKS